MAVSETRVRPPEFIEAAGKTFLSDLSKATGDFKSADLSKVYGPQFVAGLDPLQQKAVKDLQAGLDSFKPFLQTAASRTGPDAYKDFMSPFQRDVIDATLQEFDQQSSRGLANIRDRAVAAGAFGGARQGVQEGQFQADTDRNRAALQAQLLAQGFQQGQRGAQQDLQNQLTLASTTPALQGQQIAGLTTLGGALQQQKQSELGAQQQLNIQNLMQPLTAAQQYGSGVTQLIAGYPGKSVQEVTPNPSGLQSLISAGAGLAGIYRTLNPAQRTA